MNWLFVLGLMTFTVHHYLLWTRSPSLSLPLKSDWVPPSDAPLVSFLVPAWRAAEDIEAFLRAFQALRYPHKELVLCAGGDDDSYALAQKHRGAHVQLLRQMPGEGKQGALRRSLEHAQGNIIYLTDIDCRPQDEVVHALLEPLVQGRAQITSGTVRPLDEQLDNALVIAQWAVERLNAWRSSAIIRGLRGANAALHCSALVAAGSFEQAAPSGTDYTLARELTQRGYLVHHIPHSDMPTAFPDTLPVYARKQARWLRNVVVLGVRYGLWRDVIPVLKTLVIPFVLAALALVGIFHPWLWLIVGGLVLHAVLNRFHYAHVSHLQVHLQGVLSTVIGDLFAALLATSQLMRRRLTWS